MTKDSTVVPNTAHRTPPNAGKGRKKGVPNKITASVKQALTEAFERLGGVPALVSWGERNPDGFYGLWGRLAPREVEMSGPEGAALVIKVVRE